MQYPSGESGYSFGKLKSINDNFEFAHSASTLPGSSGSPIILKQTSKVIGIHKMGGTSQNYGDFIGPIFNYFRNYSKNNERHENLLDNIIIKDNNKYKNMIQGVLDITPNDINKNIVLFYTDMNNNIDVYINNENINDISVILEVLKYEKSNEVIFEHHPKNDLILVIISLNIILNVYFPSFSKLYFQT